jgi:SRSO17 transposase
VSVSSVWADESIYYPLHIKPYTPAERLAGGRADPAFRTKPQIGVELVYRAREAGILFRAVVADSVYGESPNFEGELWKAKVPYVLSLRPHKGRWAEQSHDDYRRNRVPDRFEMAPQHVARHYEREQRQR